MYSLKPQDQGQYKNYKRIALVCHSAEDLAEYRERAMQVADYCKQWE